MVGSANSSRGDSNDNHAIPSINITTDSSTPALIILPDVNHNVSTLQSPVSAGLLSPISYNPRSSYDGPPSPAFSDISDTASALTTPPSPTLSNHSSVHFQSSLALRDNKPEQKSGMSSLGLLNPYDLSTSGLSHHRKLSNATFSSMTETEGDHADAFDLRHMKSNATSFTHVDSHSISRGSHKKTDSQEVEYQGRKPNLQGEHETDGEHKTAHQRELAQDDAIDCTPFEFKPFQLAHMLDPKSLELLASFGGTGGLLRGLGTSADHGLTSPPHRTETVSESGELRVLGAGQGASHRHEPERGGGNVPLVPQIMLTEPNGGISSPTESENPAARATFEDRRRVYGENVLPHRASKTLLQLMWMALKDKVLILLSIAAVVSLALGLFQDLKPNRDTTGAPVDWVEGVAIMVAIAIVVIVGSLNDWQKERQFQTLKEKKEERGVKVIRDGVEKVVDVKEVVVGDIALLEPGEIIPCDGIFISGHNVRCDESGATGESDAIRKVPFHDVVQLHTAKDSHAEHTDCFMISGSKVLEGVGKYVIVAVGTKSFNGRIMMALRGDAENTPLQIKLNYLAELIAKIGSVAGLLLFISLMIRFIVQVAKGDPARTPNQNGMAFVDILIIAVTLIVVAVPEGLPLAVTLALAFATKRMTKENLLVRVLGSCETMANANVICTDKTGTLTQNSMKVVAGSLGIHAKFVRQLDDNAARSNAEEMEQSTSGSEQIRKHYEDFSIDQANLTTILPPQLRELLNESIAVNSSAFQDIDPETGEKVFIGSKTETALLQFAHELGCRDYKEIRDAADIIQMIPFSSERKFMGVVVRLSSGRFRLYAKGASEILSKECVQHVVVRNQKCETIKVNEEVEVATIDDLAQDNISRTIIFYANQTLRTIALCYKDFESWPPLNTQLNEEGEVPVSALTKELTLIAITGIEDPLREGVRDAVLKCHRAGVTVKMCTGDNVLTARSIATQCGIFTKGGIIMEGPVFRKLSHVEMMEIVPRLQVLARSSPEDKKILVETLKRNGEIVAVTGDGTNDGPALKTAHVGFSMGIAGTEVAKEASDIILMDDNFASIVKAIMWGRCVNDAVRKFLQFQISTNVTAVVITFVSALASVDETSVLSAVQLLWINIIMDTFAALALATDPATESLLERMPDKKTAPLFSVEMYKMILFQSLYQIAIILIFHFLGSTILGFDGSAHSDDVVKTLVFNAFVFAQIFNSVNSRRLDNKLNIFEGILKNRYFLVITFIEIVVQVLIVFVGGAAFQVTRIPGREWGISIALGVVSIPLGVLVRCLPNGPFEKLFTLLGLFGKPEVLPTRRPDADTWNGAITLVRDNLSIFSNIRGGRVRSSSVVVKSRSARLSQEFPQLRMSSILTMAPTLMAGAVATGGCFQRQENLSDPAHADPSKSSAALWEGKLQMHPETPLDDPVYQRFATGAPNLA